jgi:hypothetical protein
MRIALNKPALLEPRSLRVRLWQMGGLLAVLTLVVGGVNFVQPDDSRVTPSMLGHDFLPFYMAGTMVRQGDVGQLYDLETSRDFQQRLANTNNLQLGGSFGPWWNPPHFAWLFAPYSALPYRVALAAWTLTGVLCLVAAMVLLIGMLPRSDDDTPADFRTWGLIPLLILVSMPFAQAISHGQNTFLSLLILAATVALWRSDRALLAGMTIGLLFYKPQLAAVVSVMLVLTMGSRALLGLTFTGLATLSLTVNTLPGTLGDWLTRLPDNLRVLQVDQPYFWERHVTLRAFWRLLLQGYEVGAVQGTVVALTTGVSVLLVGGLLLAAYRQARLTRPGTPWHTDTRSIRRDRLISATIVVAPLVVPFYFDYDLLLLAIPATLLARERLLICDAEDRGRLHTWAVRLLALTYLWTLFNPALTQATHVNGVVILLAALSAVLIARACPTRLHAIHGEVSIDPRVLPVTIRRAA